MHEVLGSQTSVSLEHRSKHVCTQAWYTALGSFGQIPRQAERDPPGQSDGGVGVGEGVGDGGCGVGGAGLGGTGAGQFVSTALAANCFTW